VVLLNPTLLHHWKILEGGKGEERDGPRRHRVDRKNDANHAHPPEVFCQEKAKCNSILLLLLLATTFFFNLLLPLR